MSEHKRSKPAGNPPISRHPLFPAIVALWFGALFGAGSIAVPPALIERIVTALGVDQVLPMAAPPLGPTARTLFALAITGLGAAIGALAARRVVSAAPDAPERRRAVAPVAAHAPARHEPPALSGRRRALSIEPRVPAEEIRPGGDDPAPVREAGILNVAEFDLDGFDAAAADSAAPVAAEPETCPQAESPDAEAAAPALPAAASGANLFDTFARGIAAPSGTAAPFTAPAEPHDAGANALEAALANHTAVSELTDNTPPHAGFRAAERIAAAQLDELSPLELLERLALAMAQRRASAHNATPAEHHLPEPVEQAALAGAVTAGTTVVAMAVSEPVSHPLPFTTPRLQAAPVEATAPPAAMAMPAPQPQPDQDTAPIPAALRPVNVVDLPDDEDDDALPGYIPPRHIGLTAHRTAEAAEPGIAASLRDYSTGHDEEADDDDELEEGYSSLLDLSRPAGNRDNPLQQFIAITEEEALYSRGETPDAPPFAPPASAAQPAAPLQGDRLFDGPGKLGPEDTEQALRDALAALQRMSGAA